MAESSDTKFLNEYRRAIDIFSADTNWNPTNPLLVILTMEAQLTDGETTAQDVPVKLAPQKININTRQEVYAKFAPFARRSRSYLKSSGASKLEMDDAETYIRKILGTRATPKIKDNPDTPENEAAASNSAAQLSYDSRLGNLRGYRAFLGNMPIYNPNETDVKLTTADTIIDDAENSNKAVSAGFVPLSSSRRLRDQKLYTNENSIYEVIRLAKEYYKSLYGAKSPQYRTIAALKFNRPRSLR